MTAKKKVCKKCRIFTSEDKCPVCKGTDFSSNWKGRMVIEDPEKSEIAKKLGITMKGEYAIKVK